MVIPTNADFFRLCHEDHEFKMASRFWTGGIQFEIGDILLCFPIMYPNGHPLEFFLHEKLIFCHVLAQFPAKSY